MSTDYTALKQCLEEIRLKQLHLIASIDPSLLLLKQVLARERHIFTIDPQALLECVIALQEEN